MNNNELKNDNNVKKKSYVPSKMMEQLIRQGLGVNCVNSESKTITFGYIVYRDCDTSLSCNPFTSATTH